jgi:hypothetical protein
MPSFNINACDAKVLKIFAVLGEGEAPAERGLAHTRLGVSLAPIPKKETPATGGRACCSLAIVKADYGYRIRMPL